MNRASDIVRTIAPLLDRLASRWTDEQAYEDIADYGQVIAAKLPDDAMFLAMKKRPFGFAFRINEATFQVSVTARAIKVREIERAA